MVLRTIEIEDTVNFWLNDFRAKMLEHERQSIGYSTMLNMIARLGTVVLAQPDKLTSEQKTIILGFIEESNTYKPPYARIKWSDAFFRHMIPKILEQKDVPAYYKQTFKYLTSKNNS